MTKVLESRILLDSGAFSAWNKGKIISFEDYIQFYLKNKNEIDYVVNLDIIPGKPFQKPTKEQIKESAKGGWNNYIRMINEGVEKEKLIHVFHQGEDFKWLMRMNKMDYIGISPANDKNTTQKLSWLKECMKYINDDTKFHGFGVTALKLILEFPWYSIDSASWTLRGGAYGLIDLPNNLSLKRKEDFFINSIFVSRGKTKKQIDNICLFNNIENISQFDITFKNNKYKERVSSFLSQFGFILEEMIDSREMREAWNGFYLVWALHMLGVQTEIYFSSVKKTSMRILLKALSRYNIPTSKINFLFSYGLDRNILGYLIKLKNTYADK